jgi:hypothetical protein
MASLYPSEMRRIKLPFILQQGELGERWISLSRSALVVSYHSMRWHHLNAQWWSLPTYRKNSDSNEWAWTIYSGQFKYTSQSLGLVLCAVVQRYELFSFVQRKTLSYIYATRRTSWLEINLVLLIDTSGLIPMVRLGSWSAPASYHNNMWLTGRHIVSTPSYRRLYWVKLGLLIRGGIHHLFKLLKLVPP